MREGRQCIDGDIPFVLFSPAIKSSGTRKQKDMHLREQCRDRNNSHML
jgi:hypothetical protein